MLPSSHRLRRSSDFAVTVRHGARARRGTVVVHQRDAAVGAAGVDPTPRPAVVGFVVSRAVGDSVVRHRVTRRLRHVVRAHLAELPEGSSTVVRALPGSARADSAALDSDFRAALATVRQAQGRSRS